MKSTTICMQCRMALHVATAGAATSARAFLPELSLSSTRTWQGTRAFSVCTAQRQQAAQRAPQQNERTPPPMAPPPTSTPTTSPADPNTSTPSDRPPSSTSTAHMQRAINTHLSKPILTTKLAQTFAKSLPNTASTYITYGITESLFNSCSTPTNYLIPESQRTSIMSGRGPTKTASGEDIGQPDPPLALTPQTSTANNDTIRHFFFHTLALLPTFSTWSQATFLHMYLLTVRLRSLPPSSPSTPGSFHNFQQYLLEHFSQSAELKMNILHTITARGIRNRYLKDLFIQWRGVIAAYDQGMVEGDAVLGSAVWRNLFKGDEDVDWVKVGLVVGYMRRAIVELEKIKEIQPLAKALDGPQGVWARSVVGLEGTVDQESAGMKQALE